MKEKIIHAIFNDEQDVLTAVKALKDNDVNVNEVFSPFPIHGLDPILGLKETRMAITAFIYGCIGLTFGALLIYYIMISGEGKSWSLNIGGKPNQTFYHNLPSFVPIIFECTVLFAAHLMSITYLFRNKLYPGSVVLGSGLVELEPGYNLLRNRYVIDIKCAAKSTVHSNIIGTKDGKL